MINLNDPKIYKQIDPSSMLSQLYGLPGQCQTAWQEALGFSLPEDYASVDKVLILGMGGSAIGGDLVRTLALATGSKPVILVNRDYDLPAYINDRTLVIASSYSGNTEEILSAFNQALNTECKKLAITTGGKLKEIAEAASIPVFPINHVSSPRAALGYSFMPLIAFLVNLGLIKGNSINTNDMINNLNQLTGNLGETVPTDSNSAKQLALKLYDKVAVIYGAGILSEVARRWKTQINENSKAWAFHEIFPELNHNTVVGYQFPRQAGTNLYVVLLRCPSLHHRTLIRLQVTGELLEQNNIEYHIVDSQGEDSLSQMMSVLFFGDWVSYYLAILNQADPTPVKTIDYLKKRLDEVK